MTGMNQEETKSMMDLVKKINQSGITVLIVEHNMKAVMEI
jgi:branched-chain amino acid transport system ATP-binding protein